MPELLRATIERLGRLHGDRPALTVPGAHLSYAGLDDLANRGADMLARLGVVEGEIVMVRCGNGLPLVATWLGCVKLGAVFMPVNALLIGEPLVAVMGHAAGRVAVVDATLLPQMLAVRDRLPGLREVVVAGAHPSPGAHSFERLLEDAASAPPRPLSDDPAAPARLMYTSGTTGRPKGALWSRTAESLHAQCYGDELVRTRAGEAVYSCLPLFHATCQGTLLGTLWRGGHMHVDAAFDAFSFWSRVRETRAVFFPYVGTILSVLARRPPRPDDHDNPVRRIMGSAAPADRWRDLEERFGLLIEDVWGQTELASCWTLPTSVPARPGTVGRPAARFEARLALPDGTEPPPGTVAELWIRPREPHVVFEGYLRDEAGTAGMWTPDGWYRSGDLMHREEDGDYVFGGRLRDAIRRRGEMISPAHIEDAALARPGVFEAAAVGVPAPLGVEEEVKLCVVAQPGVDLNPGTLHAALRETLPDFMVPRYIQVYEEFPKTPTTRIQKYRLQADGIEAAWDARHAQDGGTAGATEGHPRRPDAVPPSVTGARLLVRDVWTTDDRDGLVVTGTLSGGTLAGGDHLGLRRHDGRTVHVRVLAVEGRKGAADDAGIVVEQRWAQLIQSGTVLVVVEPPPGLDDDRLPLEGLGPASRGRDDADEPLQVPLDDGSEPSGSGPGYDEVK